MMTIKPEHKLLSKAELSWNHRSEVFRLRVDGADFQCRTDDDSRSNADTASQISERLDQALQRGDLLRHVFAALNEREAHASALVEGVRQMGASRAGTRRQEGTGQGSS